MPRTRVDYATDQITVYRYCSYGCRYCYVWRNKLFAGRVMRGKYDPVEEARRYLGKTGRTIVVSFVSDPYPPEEDKKRLTRRVLEILCRSRNRVMVLTKNPVLALRDLDVMGQGDCWLGTTVITTHPWWHRVLEPRAPPPLNRLLALFRAREKGIHTWLSIEPIIPRVTDLDVIAHLAVELGIDYVVLGRYNYWKHISLPEAQYLRITEGGHEFLWLDANPTSEEELVQWYREHVPKTIDFLKEHGVKYHIKKELAKVLNNA
ncbi:MAG: radical SAM protein [Crenarchaeota archaeon]|nr:radical SAM protein [Thermoproteota archaeon]